MVNFDDFDRKTFISIGQYGLCCVSVECSEVTVLAVAQVYRLVLCQTGFPQNFLKYLQKNISKEFSELLLIRVRFWC